MFQERFFDPLRTMAPEAYTDSQIKPDQFAGMNEEERAKRRQDMQKEKTNEDFLTNLLVGLTRDTNGRGVPQQNPAKNNGLKINGDPSVVQKDTLTPLPFDQYYSKTANIVGIINSMEPDLYQRNEQVHQIMRQSAPEAVKALQYRPSIYEGVPKDFYVNRFNIALQRKRENDVYAFI